MDQQELDAVEKELLELIVRHLEDNKMDVPTAQKLAKDFLAVLPVENRADLLEKLKALGENYDEAKQVYFQEISKDNEVKEQVALQNMSHAIRQGNIDHALTIAKDLKEATN
jgi:hypothetical protein